MSTAARDLIWQPSLLDGAEPVDGGMDLEVPAPIDHTPAFVRAGAVLPMDEDGQLMLHLYAPPDGGTGSGVLYRDAGEGYGPWRVDRFTTARQGSVLQVAVTSEGQFDAGPVEYRTHGGVSVEGLRP